MRFTEKVIPKVGKYKNQVILVSPRQKKRLLLLDKVRVPNAAEKKKKGRIKPLENKTEKAVENRQDK